MKQRILLVVAMLLIASPAMAAVTITATATGTTVAITYSCTDGEQIRAFAINVNADTPAQFVDVCEFKAGESTSAAPGYGIFPARFRDLLNPADPNWATTNYNPVAPYGEPDAYGLPSGWVVLEMGALYVGDGNKPGSSGTLCKLVVDPCGATDIDITPSANTLRGGIVDINGNTVTAAFVPGVVNPAPVGCTMPDCAGLNRVACIAALTGAGFTTITEANVAPTAAGQAVGQVIAQSPAAGTVVTTPCAASFSAVNYPIKFMTTTASLYVNWVGRSKPACWAYPRQCRGGADGKKQISYWVGSNNLNLLKASFNKAETALNAITNGYCPSADHKKQISYWVGSNNLNILKTYFNKAESAVPLCATNTATGIPIASAGFSADANYWYWCIPTSGGTCPSGQYCAPAGVCPNTP